MDCRALLDRTSVIILDLLPKLTLFLAMLTPLLFLAYAEHSASQGPLHLLCSPPGMFLP